MMTRTEKIVAVQLSLCCAILDRAASVLRAAGEAEHSRRYRKVRELEGKAFAVVDEYRTEAMCTEDLDHCSEVIDIFQAEIDKRFGE